MSAVSYVYRFLGDPCGYTVDVLPGPYATWVEARRGTHTERLWIDVSKAYLVEMKP